MIDDILKILLLLICLSVAVLHTLYEEVYLKDKKVWDVKIRTFRTWFLKLWANFKKFFKI